MASTLSNLRTLVMNALGDSGTVAQTCATNAINFAQNLIALMYDPPELNTSATLVLLQDESSVSISTQSSLRTITQIRNTTASFGMFPISWEKWNILCLDDASGSARFYCRRDTTLYTYPTPEAVNALTMFYKDYPTALSDASDELDFDHFDEIIVAIAQRYAWGTREEIESSNLMKQISEEFGAPLNLVTQARMIREGGAG